MANWQPWRIIWWNIVTEITGEFVESDLWSCAFSLSVTLQRLNGTKETEISDQSMRSSVIMYTDMLHNNTAQLEVIHKDASQPQASFQPHFHPGVFNLGQKCRAKSLSLVFIHTSVVFILWNKKNVGAEDGLYPQSYSSLTLQTTFLWFYPETPSGQMTYKMFPALSSSSLRRSPDTIEKLIWATALLFQLLLRHHGLTVMAVHE